MIFEPKTVSIDVEYEIVRLEVELDDLRRSSRFASLAFGLVAAGAYSLGPSWLAKLESIEVTMVIVVAGAAFAVMERLNKHRFHQVINEIAVMKLWANSYEMRHKQTMAILEEVRSKPN